MWGIHAFCPSCAERRGTLVEGRTGGGGLWHSSRTENRGSQVTDIKISFSRSTKISQ